MPDLRRTDRRALESLPRKELDSDGIEHGRYTNVRWDTPAISD